MSDGDEVENRHRRASRSAIRKRVGVVNNLPENTLDHPLCNVLPVTLLQTHLIHVSYNFAIGSVRKII